MALQWDISYVLCGCAQTPLATPVPENYVLNISYHMVIYVGRDVSSPLQMSHQTLGHVHLQHTKHDGIYIPLSIQGLHLGDTGTCPSVRSEEHTSELQSHSDLVCRLLLEKKKKYNNIYSSAT